MEGPLAFSACSKSTSSLISSHLMHNAHECAWIWLACSPVVKHAFESPLWCRGCALEAAAAPLEAAGSQAHSHQTQDKGGAWSTQMGPDSISTPQHDWRQSRLQRMQLHLLSAHALDPRPSTCAVQCQHQRSRALPARRWAAAQSPTQPQAATPPPGWLHLRWQPARLCAVLRSSRPGRQLLLHHLHQAQVRIAHAIPKVCTCWGPIYSPRPSLVRSTLAQLL